MRQVSDSVGMFD